MTLLGEWCGCGALRWNLLISLKQSKNKSLLTNIFRWLVFIAHGSGLHVFLVIQQSTILVSVDL